MVFQEILTKICQFDEVQPKQEFGYFRNKITGHRILIKYGTKAERSLNRLKRRMLCNRIPWKGMFTLTISDNYYTEQKNWSAYMRRYLNRTKILYKKWYRSVHPIAKIPTLKYVWRLEKGEKKRLHFHLLVNTYIPIQLMYVHWNYETLPNYANWDFNLGLMQAYYIARQRRCIEMDYVNTGIIFFQKINDPKKASAYIRKYISKTKKRKGARPVTYKNKWGKICHKPMHKQTYDVIELDLSIGESDRRYGMCQGLFLPMSDWKHGKDKMYSADEYELQHSLLESANTANREKYIQGFLRIGSLLSKKKLSEQYDEINYRIPRPKPALPKIRKFSKKLSYADALALTSIEIEKKFRSSLTNR